MLNIKKSLFTLCLAVSVAFAPICQANARSHHYSNSIVAAAIGGAVAGLVGGVVQNTLNPTQTVIVEQPAVVIEPEPVVIYRPYRHYHPVRYVRHRYYRYY